MHRRDFAKLSAFAATATALPTWAQSATNTSGKLRFAAVGLGGISDIFIRAIAQSEKCTLTGLVSGHAEEKAPRYQQQFSIPQSSVYTYEQFDNIAHNPSVDAVYIGLPNSMHAEYTIRAAKAGKHVLCEKPMAISSTECRAMIKACRDHNVKLMIAYRVHYDPTWLKIRDLVRSGAIGDLQGFQGGFYGPKINGWRLDRKLAGGGPLFDLGIYPLNAIRWISGEEPSSFTAQVATKIPGPRFATVEESMEFTMKFPSNLLASSGCSYGEAGPAYLNIDGTKGSLQVQPAFLYDGLKFTGTTADGPVEESSPGKNPYQFTLEADHFADCVRNNRTPATPGEEGLADQVAMEAIYKAAGHPVA